MADSRKRCGSCYFSDQCSSNGYCDDYIPLTKEREYDQLMRYVESGKREFYRAWLEYIDENI